MNILFVEGWWLECGNFMREHAEAAALYSNVFDVRVDFRKSWKHFPFSIKITKEEKRNLTVYNAIIYCPLRRFGIYERLIKITYNILISKIKNTAKIDICHLNVHTKTTKDIINLKELKGIPFVVTEHSSFYHTGIYNLSERERIQEKKEIKEWFDSKEIKYVMPVSKQLGNILVNEFEVDKNKIVSIPNVANEVFKYSPRNKKDDKIRILMAAVWDGPKNPVLFFDSYKLLPENYQKRIEVKFVGIGKYVEEVKDYLKKNNFDIKIEFLGKRTKKEIAEYLQESDFLVHPSNAENLPCIIIESFCCGRPVVSNSVNGVVELINETNGLMSAPRDVEAFSKNICQIIESIDKYDLEEISVNAKNLFYPEIVGKLIYEIYRRTLSVYTVREYQMCSHCIMDTNDDPDIAFDEKGVCSYCKMYDRFSKEIIHRDISGTKQMLETIKKIKDKDKGKNKKYDSILGVSGGVDSTYTAYLAKQYGLRPLLVHLDNGWNSELAMSNIEYVVSKLGFDLHTWVINWEEFKDIQLSFLKASVVDIELVTDYAIVASLYLMAAKHKVDYIITGHNFATEGIMPMNWVHWKSDLLNIRSIHSCYGKERISTFPQMGYFRKAAYINLFGIRTFPILNYVNYNKDEAKTVVTNELGWRDYGGKHNESLFTKFYQSYILPKKFNIDKRKAHLSTLICSGQTTREDALAEIKKPPYLEDEISEDKKYIIKKFDLTDEEFEKIMNTPIKQHTDFPSYAKIHYKYELMILEKLKPVSKPLKKYFGLRGRTNYV